MRPALRAASVDGMHHERHSRCVPGLLGGMALCALLSAGCTYTATPVWVPGVGALQAEVVQDTVGRADALATEGRPGEGVALFEEALGRPGAPQAALRYNLALFVLRTDPNGKTRARAELEKLLADHPRSPYQASAEALLSLIKEMASLQEDLRKIVDIDVEAERRRLEGGGPAP